MAARSGRAILPLELELIERVGWFIELRWFAIAGVFAAGLLGRFVFQLNLPVLSFSAIGLGLLICNTIFWRYYVSLSGKRSGGDASKRKITCTRFTSVQIIVDWLALGSIAHYSGGIQSPVLMFFIFHILIASILLSRRDCYLQTTLAVFFVIAIALLEYLQLIPHISIMSVPDAHFSDAASVIIFLSLFAATLYIAAFIATSIAMTLRSKEGSLVILQADLQETYSDLEETTAERSRFILTVTHELRAPLAAVQSMLGVIDAGYAGEVSQKAKELIERSDKRIQFLLELVGDLLDLAAERLDILRSKRVDVDLNDVMAEMIDGIRGRAEAKGVSLSTRVPDEHVTIRSDAKDMERLLGNLFSNAVKYTPEGGQAHLAMDISEDRVNFTIIDTGIGIPEEAIEKLFTEFFRAENAKKMSEYGTGLGLSIVKRIVDEHKGEITVESELGKGTKICVSLPLRTP